jgi:microcystin-dependent protein
MATVTPGTTFISGETVTPARLNAAATPVVAVADGEITTAKIADGSVALGKLVAAVQQSLLPSGAVQAFAMDSAPAGWLAADGAAVSRNTYASLFSAIGTTYGAGDGSTTFALPDLRGYFVRGSGTNADGTAAGAFGAKQADQLRAHGHTYSLAVNSSVYSHNGGAGALRTLNANAQTSSVGGAETRPANIALLYCIKF